MPRKPTIAVFATLAISSLAFAAGLQHPADQARTHPGSSAHANAVAGAAAARRIEACGNAASAMIRNLETGDAEAATADFDATMHANLDAGRLGTVWKQVGGQMGRLQGQGAPQNAMFQDYVVITLPLHFENGDVNAQVSCDSDGKVAGFYLRPAAAPSGAPASGD
jgi:hypothetical protein